MGSRLGRRNHVALPHAAQHTERDGYSTGEDEDRVPHQTHAAAAATTVTTSAIDLCFIIGYPQAAIPQLRAKPTGVQAGSDHWASDGSVQAVAEIPQAGKDIALVVEPPIHSRADDVDFGMLALKALDSRGCGDYAQHDDALRPMVLQQSEGLTGCAACREFASDFAADRLMYT